MILLIQLLNNLILIKGRLLFRRPFVNSRFLTHLYFMPSVQKNSPPVSEMAILWTGNDLFQRDAWRHG